MSTKSGQLQGTVCAASGGDIQTGPFGSQLHASDYVDTGIPSIMPQNIGDNRISEDGIARITEADAARLKRYLVREGDIVYSRRGDVERRALIRDHAAGWLCGTGCLRIRFGASSVDSEFAAYYLGHPAVRAWIVGHAQGATMPNLNTAILSALPFVVPPMSEQRSIASILGALDDKIELNRKMSATLEAMARALFTSWFVDFAPVRAKAEGRDTGLAADITALLPDSFEELDDREIPVGWSTHGLDDVATFLNGLALQKFPPIDGSPSLPVIKIAQLRAGHVIGADRADACLKPDYVIANGDILFSWSGSLECEIWVGGFGALNQHLFKVRGTAVPDWFAYLAVRHHLPAFRQIAADKATTMGHIQRHHLHEAKTNVPPQPLLDAASSIIGPMIESSWKRRLESSILAALRDTLLPKLTSGELRVPDAERFLEKSA